MRLILIKNRHHEVLASFVEPLTYAKLADVKSTECITLQEAKALIKHGIGETYIAEVVLATTLGDKNA